MTVAAALAANTSAATLQNAYCETRPQVLREPGI